MGRSSTTLGNEGAVNRCPFQPLKDLDEGRLRDILAGTRFWAAIEDLSRLSSDGFPATYDRHNEWLAQVRDENASGALTGASVRMAVAIPFLSEFVVQRGLAVGVSDEDLALKAIWQSVAYHGKGLGDIALNEFLTGKEGPEAAITCSFDDLIAHEFWVCLASARTAGLDPAEAAACFRWASETMQRAKAYWEVAKLLRSDAEGTDLGGLRDPIQFLRTEVVKAMDLGRACDPATWVPGMPTQVHLDHLRTLFLEDACVKLVPSYRDPLLALGLEPMNAHGQRAELMMAMLCAVADYVHDLVEAGEVDPKYSLYELVAIDDGQGGAKLDRRPIIRDQDGDSQDPANQARWPNTQAPRYLTRVDFSIKAVMGGSLQLLMSTWNRFQEARNKALLELACRRALHAVRARSGPPSTDQVASFRDMVRAHLFGFRALTAEEQTCLGWALGLVADEASPTETSAGQACAWFDELAALMVLGPWAGAIWSGHTPASLQAETLRVEQARTEAANFALLGLARLS
jgi:hypothetical protein